jgi:hypothetical protein
MVGTSRFIKAGAGLIGTQGACVIRAAQNLLGPLNVWFQWMENVFPARSALQLCERREHHALYLNRLSWIGVLAIGLFSLLLPTIDGWLMETVHGAAYRSFAVLVVLQALYFLFGLYLMRTSCSPSVGRAGEAKRSAWLAVVAVSLAVLAVTARLSERGIMITLLAGEVAAIVYLVRRHASDSPPVGTEARYLQWQGAGRMRLVLPLANNRVLRGALNMYFPTRWTGKMYRPLLATALPVLARSGFGRLLQGSGSWCVHLPRLVQMVPGARSAWVGCHQATDGRQAKMTLRLMDEHGRALAYARVGHDAADVQTVSDEALVLAAVAATDVSTQAPRLINHGRLIEPDGYFLLESAGPEKAAPMALDHRHFRFLQNLVRNGTTRPWSALMEEITDEFEWVCECDGPVRQTLTHLQQLPLPAMPVCIEHGDFAPWNIREQTSGDLFVLDWDRAALRGVPWLDALHHCFQVETLVRRRPAAAVIRRMKAVFVEPSARCYAELIPSTADMASPIMFFYLLRTLLRDIRDDPRKTFSHGVRVEALQQLLQEERVSG